MSGELVFLIGFVFGLCAVAEVAGWALIALSAKK